MLIVIDFMLHFDSSGSFRLILVDFDNEKDETGKVHLSPSRNPVKPGCGRMPFVMLQGDASWNLMWFQQVSCIFHFVYLLFPVFSSRPPAGPAGPPVLSCLASLRGAPS